MSTNEFAVNVISGSEELLNWFGAWPSFHDAEIIELTLRRVGESWLKVHTWILTGEKDDSGYYARDKNTVVTFCLDNIKSLDLTGFSQQNVVQNLVFSSDEEGISLEMVPCFGLSGTLIVERVSVTFEPGSPNRD